MSASLPLLEVKKLSFAYGDQRVLQHINLQLYAGETLGLIGESGSGKTSLLKLMGGLLEPGAGEILFRGQKVAGPALNLIPGHPEIKVVNQEFDLMPYLSVEDNLLRHNRSASESAQRRMSGYFRRRLKLKNLSRHRAVDTSGGQKQRLAMGTALAARPSILLLDEPFSNLDYPLKQEIIELLQSEWQPAAMVLVTHEPSDLLALASRVVVLERGRIVQSGSSSEIYHRPKNEKIGRLLGPLNFMTGADARAAGLSEGSHYLRPHQLQLAEAGLLCEVISVSFQGSHYRLHCQACQSKKPYQVNCPEPYPLASQVSLSWRHAEP